MTREGYDLRANSVVWNRTSGEVRAIGAVRIISPEGDVAYADNVVLEDTLRDGVVENLLLVLADGGRLAAVSAERRNGITTLHRAAYTACAVVDENGCPRDPTWQINAVRVVHDPVRHRISYQGAALNLLGMPVFALPGLSHPDGSQGGGSGLLVPEIRFSRQQRLRDQRALLPPHRAQPRRDHHAARLFRRAADDRRRNIASSPRSARSRCAAISPTARACRSTAPAGTPADDGIRAYIEGNGRFQLSPVWSITASGRYVTDRTFLRRYDISRDDRLRSVVDVERIGRTSYISIAGWAFEGLRVTDVDGTQPIALPAIDARWRLADPWLGGRIELQANSLALLRLEGQDTQRAFASAQWQRRMLTPLGQELTFTAYGRGDVYHTNDMLSDPTVAYRGEEGWSGRFIGAAAADLRWPFIGPFMGGTQRITPRLQFVASPPTENIDIPNEDARAVDLEDSNLFALNRFPGYDRWEDGVRVTYGADWDIDLPGASRPQPISARAIGSAPAPRSCRPAPAFPTASPISSAGPTSGSAGG